MDRLSEAQAIIEGGDASAAELQLLARELRDAGRSGLVAEMLTAVAGAIYKRRWVVDAKRIDLENALACSSF